MSSLAAAGDTWGIYGPEFLTIYFTAASLVMLVSLAHLAWLFAKPFSPDTVRLSVEQTAYLSGGRRLAFYTALGELRVAGAVGAVVRRLLIRTGPMPADTTALQRSIYNALARHARTKDVFRDAGVAVALGDVRRWLEDRGLLLSAAHRRVAMINVISMLILLGVGGQRAAAGIRDDEPVGFLTIGLIVLVGCQVVLIMPLRTRAGNAVLQRLRAENVHLSPKRSPDYFTYGASSLGMGVALYGTGALCVADPVFASTIGISAAPSNGDHSGDSCGCGGGCGGCGCGGCGG